MHVMVQAKRGVGSRSARVFSAVLRPMWQQTGMPGLFDGGKEAVVARVEIVELADLGRKHRQLQGFAAERAATRSTSWMARSMSWMGTWAVTTRRRGSAEANSSSASLKARVASYEPSRHQVEVAVGADLAVEHLDVDAVGVHVPQPLDRVAVSGAAVGGMDVGEAGHVRLGGVPTEHLAHGLRKGVVVGLVERRCQVGLDDVVRQITWESDEMSGGVMTVPPVEKWRKPWGST